MPESRGFSVTSPERRVRQSRDGGARAQGGRRTRLCDRRHRALARRSGAPSNWRLAVADLGNPVYVAMMRAIEGVVRSRDTGSSAWSTGPSPDNEVETIRGMSRGYADGLIVSPLRITDQPSSTNCWHARVPDRRHRARCPRRSARQRSREPARGMGLATTTWLEGGRRRSRSSTARSTPCPATPVSRRLPTAR